MTLVEDPAIVARVTGLVQGALDRRQPQAYRIVVRPEGILEEDGKYHVVVGTQDDVRTYDFYNVLADAEEELEDQNNLDVLLVPALAD